MPTWAPGGDDNKGVATVKTGLLGADLSRDEGSGFYHIDKILQGAPYSSSLISPLAQQGLNVKEGDYIVAIDGIPTNTVANIYNLLVGKAGVMTELTINSSASLDGALRIVVKPIDDEYPLRHYAWVQNNIKKVNETTDGRVGYIYIPDMGPDGLNEFVRYYYPQLNKEALIIDDRANGGGNISPMVIERLLRTPLPPHHVSRLDYERHHTRRHPLRTEGVAYQQILGQRRRPVPVEFQGRGTWHRDRHSHMGRHRGHNKLAPLHRRNRCACTILHQL